MKYCDQCHASYPGDFSTCPRDQNELRSITELMPGLVLRGKYEILARLGAGGMGAVYKARHMAFDEVRALKVIGTHLASNQDFLARFKSEAVLARKLQHPNVVRVEDFDATEAGLPFIVMEYVEGRSLRSLLNAERVLAPRRAVGIARQTLQGLGAAHALGILHRDIKPENLVLVAAEDGTEAVKVLDFGLAKALAGFEGAGQQVSTQTGMIIGTPQYIAPELALPDKGLELDGRADLYSLGVLLYELVTGALPFEADTPMGMVLQHLQTRPRPPHLAHPELSLPPALSFVVMKALEKDRERRYRNAEEMETALAALGPLLPADRARPAESPAESFVATRPGAPRADTPATLITNRKSPPARIAPTAPATRGPSQPTPVTARRSRPALEPRDEAPAHRGWSAWLAALALVGALWLALRWNRAPEPPAPSLEPAVEVDAPPQAAARERPSDAAIQNEVQQLIAGSSALTGAWIQTSVANGIVTLSGEAGSSPTRDLAGSLAASARGVRRVFNLVQVANEVPAEASTDIAQAETHPAPMEAPNAPQGTELRPRPRPMSASETQVRELLTLARSQVEAGDHEGARRTFESVLRLDPGNPIATDALERVRRHPPPPRGGGPPPRP